MARQIFKVFEVEIEIIKTVRVRLPVPSLIVRPGDNAEEIAHEIALGGIRDWPEYVIHEDQTEEVLAVREIAQLTVIP